MICTKCKIDKSENDFYKHKNLSSRGKRQYSECKICFKTRMGYRHQEHKDILVAESGGKCVNCGYNKSSRILHFHHVDPSTKSFEISDRLSTDLDVLRQEIKKCILLCPNCHNEKHLNLW